MSGVSVKFVSVIEVSFPRNERALSWIFPKMSRNKGAPFERSQMSLNCRDEIGSPLFMPGKKDEIETTRFYNNFTQVNS